MTKEALKPKVFYYSNVYCSVFSKKMKTKDGRSFISHSISLTQAYIDADTGERKFTSSVDGRKAAIAIQLMQLAFEYISMNSKNEAEEANDVPVEAKWTGNRPIPS